MATDHEKSDAYSGKSGNRHHFLRIRRQLTMRKMMLIQKKPGIGIIFDASAATVILKDDAY